MNYINLIIHANNLSFRTAWANSIQVHKEVEQTDVITTGLKKQKAAKAILPNFFFKEAGRLTVSSIINHPSKNIKVS